MWVNREACAVTAKHKGKRAAFNGICDGRNDASPHHINCLVPPMLDRVCRANDIRESDNPAIWKRSMVFWTHGGRERGNNRKARVEVGCFVDHKIGLIIPWGPA
jgi:hypothetical protein